MTLITSPLRLPGGKARALKKILPFVPKSYSEYREPFLGGASVFVALKQQRPRTFCRINDLNPDVYSFWKTLQEQPKLLIQAITQVKKDNKDGRGLYSKFARSNVSGVFDRALRFYILNRITYSGITDCGGYSAEAFKKRFTSSRIGALPPLAKLLKNVKITNESYEQILFEDGEDVFIYLDPPYWNARDFSLYGRNGDMNRFFDHAQFAANVRKCKHTWLITCDDSKFIRDLFSFARIYPWNMKYNGMHKKKAIDGKELFITNYEPTDSQTKLADAPAALL